MTREKGRFTIYLFIVKAADSLMLSLTVLLEKKRFIRTVFVPRVPHFDERPIQ